MTISTPCQRSRGKIFGYRMILRTQKPRHAAALSDLVLLYQFLRIDRLQIQLTQLAFVVLAAEEHAHN